MTFSDHDRLIDASFDADAQKIARRQYLNAADQGSIAQMFRRVGQGVARGELQYNGQPGVETIWGERFTAAMQNKEFCPGGRVMAGVGTIHGNVLNCFVQRATTYAPDTFEGLMELVRKLALVTKVGGGNGLTLDDLPDEEGDDRPRRFQGTALLSIHHPDALVFALGEMSPRQNPEDAKVSTPLRHFRRVLYMDETVTTTPEREVWLAATVAGVPVLSRAAAYGLADADQGVIVVPDDLGGIMDAASGMLAGLMAGESGHPVIDLSLMRGEGTPITGSGGTSSGPYPFLAEIFDLHLAWLCAGGLAAGPIAALRYLCAPTLRVVRQGGTRRGAGMGTMSILNRWTLNFLTAKDNDVEAALGDIATFNVSLLVPDSVMNAVEHDELLLVDYLGVPGKYRRRLMDEPYTGTLLDAVEDGETIVPVYLQDGVRGIRGVPARWLWREIARHAWASGEPGLLFVDRINAYSALYKLGPDFWITSTNPCGEIPQRPGESCDLGASNLAAFVKANRAACQYPDEAVTGPFGAYFDLGHFARQAREVYVRFLDNVLDINLYALPDNQETGQSLRRLGLGFMGLADALILMGYRYDSQEGRDFAELLSDKLAGSAVQGSEDLAGERGVYEVYRQHAHAKDGAGLPLIDHAPRRNVALVTVAPTGTTSMLFGVSSGIEPIFSPFIWRKIGAEYRPLTSPLFTQLLEEYPAPAEFALPLTEMDLLDGRTRQGWNWDLVVAGIQKNSGSVQGLLWIPERIREVFVCAGDIHPDDHVRMQATVQRAFDRHGLAGNSISKTINMPNSATVEDVLHSYTLAYTEGCKGTTVYRDGSRKHQVLNVTHAEGDAEAGAYHQRSERELVGDLLALCTGWREAVLERLGMLAAPDPDGVYPTLLPVDHLRRIRDVLRVYKALPISQQTNFRGWAQEQGEDFFTLGASALSEAQTMLLRLLLGNVDRHGGTATLEALDLFGDILGVRYGYESELAYRAPSSPRYDDRVPSDPDELDDLVDVLGVPAHEVELLGDVVVLSGGAAEAAAAEGAGEDPVALGITNLPYVRPPRMVGLTDMVKVSETATGKRHTYLVTVNTDGRVPREVVLTAGRSGEEANADSEALGRVVSIALQYGVPADALIKTLRGINGGLYGSYSGRLVASKADLIAVALESAAVPAPQPEPAHVPATVPAAAASAPQHASVAQEAEQCPTCGERSVIRQAGCKACITAGCGYSKCG